MKFPCPLSYLRETEFIIKGFTDGGGEVVGNRLFYWAYCITGSADSGVPDIKVATRRVALWKKREIINVHQSESSRGRMNPRGFICSLLSSVRRYATVFIPIQGLGSTCWHAGIRSVTNRSSFNANTTTEGVRFSDESGTGLN